MKFIVIGQGLLGTSISQKLPGCFTTSRLEFDLETAEDIWPEADAAFIGAAITNQKQCELNPEKAWFINVTQTLKLISQLRAKKIHVVFPSTDLAENPSGMYSKTKAAVEKEICDFSTVVRLPKILDKNSGIIKEWAGQEVINAFDNLFISPVSLNFAADYIIKLMREKPIGLQKIYGEQVSYENLARKLGYTEINVQSHPNPVNICPSYISQSLEDVLAEVA